MRQRMFCETALEVIKLQARVYEEPTKPSV